MICLDEMLVSCLLACKILNGYCSIAIKPPNNKSTFYDGITMNDDDDDNDDDCMSMAWRPHNDMMGA